MLDFVFPAKPSLALIRELRLASLAGVAQLVEQLIRNQQVTCSSHVAGSSFLRQVSLSMHSLTLNALLTPNLTP